MELDKQGKKLVKVLEELTAAFKARQSKKKWFENQIQKVTQ